jgi:hypothetical protein
MLRDGATLAGMKALTLSDRDEMILALQDEIR